MIVALASCYWLLLWVSAPAGSRSAIKENYPQIDQIELVRQRFLDHLTGFSEDAKGLVAGLAIGERNLIGGNLEIAMRELSLTHLVAVSGANLAIVLGSIYFLTAFLGWSRNLRFLLALLVMSLYVLLVGPESSVIRAATMALFVMLGMWLGRGSNPIYSLASAVLLLLTIDPGLATDVGFGLSAFATAGLVGLTPVIYQRLANRVNKVLAAAIAATSAAQLYTLPIILYLQPSLPLYSIAANILVEWVVAPVTILGMLAVVTSSVFPPLAQLLSLIASLGTQWIVLVAESLSQLPFVRLHFPPGAWGIGSVTAIAIFITLWLRSNRYSQASLIAALLVTGITLSWIAADILRIRSLSTNWQVYACDVGQGDALLIRSGAEVALIDVGPDADLLARCLEMAGVSSISLLVLTHFDADHVGGIAGLRSTAVGRVLISPFRDDRPLVSVVQREVERMGLMAEFGSNGMQGRLGGFSWQILAPSATAQEAVDSNDASLVIVFDLEHFTLLALGDLGADGQLRLLKNQPRMIAQLAQRELILKVAHHGSADQLAELYENLKPDFALFLVGKNRYGHPTQRAIELAVRQGAVVLRTDIHGPIALGYEDSIRYRLGGKLSA